MRANRIALALLIVSVGCSHESKPRTDEHHDPQQARAALVSALEAWKKGAARALARRTPPIRFEDEDFAAGLRLSDYEIEEPDGAPIGLHKNVPVILSLRDSRGKVIRRETCYQVATGPALAVLRSEP